MPWRDGQCYAQPCGDRPLRRRGVHCRADLVSRFSIGPLIGDDSRARVELIRISPGGTIGRHPASASQLFAVVMGSAWVSGADGVGRTIEAGYGAVWAAGEDDDAHSPYGATAVLHRGRA